MANVGAVARLHQREVVLDKLQNIVPLLDQNYDFTGKWYDPRDPNAPEQPNPGLLRAHLPYLAAKHPNIPVMEQLKVGEPIEDFDPIDIYESQGALSSIWNMTKAGFNESLTGMAVGAGQRMLGMEPRDVFDMSHWEATEFERVGAQVASLFMPVDIATIFVGGGAGGMVARTAISAAVKRSIAKKVLQGVKALGAKRELRKQFLALMRRAASDIPKSAGAIGAYSGTGNALDQIIRTGEFDMVETFIEAAKGAGLGAMVGAGGAVAGRFGVVGREIGHVGAGTATFGIAAPLLEGEVPTGEGVRDALRFMVALRAVQGATTLPGRARKGLKLQRDVNIGEPEVAKAAEQKLRVWDKTKDLKRSTPAEETPSMKNLKAALDEGKIDKGTYNTAFELIQSRKDLDHRTAISFSDEVKKVSKKAAKDAGLEGDLRITGKTKKFEGIEKDVVKTAIKLFKGADAETVVHEWNHDAYWRLTKQEKSLFQKYHSKTVSELSASEMEGRKSVREHFADEATEFFFSEKLHERAGPIRSLFERSKAVLKQLIGRIRKFREANIPKEILDLYRKELLRDRKAKMRKAVEKPLAITEGELKHGKGFTMKPKVEPTKTPQEIRVELAKTASFVKRQSKKKRQTEIDFQLRKAENLAGFWGDKAKERAKSVSRFFDPVKPVEKRLRSAPGKKFVSDIEQAQAEHAHLRGAYLEALRDAGVQHFGKLRQWITGQKSMTEWQAKQLVDKEGNLKSPAISRVLEAFRLHINKEFGMKIPKVDKYFTRMLKSDIKEQVYGDLAQLKKALGDTETWSDKAVAAHLTKASKITRELLSHVEGKDMMAKIRALDRFAQQDVFRPVSFELPRKLKLPSKFYETDVREVLPQYIDAMAKRAAIVKVFGAKGEKMLGKDGLLDKIYAADPAEGKVAFEALRQFTGVDEFANRLSPRMQKAVNWYTAFEVGTKIALGRATLLNFSQWAISILPDLGVFPTLKGGLKIFDPKFRKELRIAGVLRPSMLEASLGYTPGGWMGKFADHASRLSGFTGINRVLQYWAAAAAHEVIPGWQRLARSGGVRGEWAKKRLKDFGLGEKSTPEQEMRAIYKFATDSQLQQNILKDPLIFNNSRFRSLFLFKRFGYKQFNFMKDMIIREAKRNNYMPIVRLAIAGYAGGEAMIYALNNIQSWLSGEPVYRKDDSLSERMFNNIAIIGAFGMAGDMIEIDRMSSLAGKAKFIVAPVFVMDVEKALEAYTRFVSDWERYGDGWLATKRNTHSIFGFLGSYPRYASKRLRTESQKENRQKYLKGKERSEILSLLADGHGEAAADRQADWNKNYKTNPITYSDVSLSELRKYLKRRFDSKLKAMGKVSPEERREVLKELREKMQQATSISRGNK